MPTPPPLSGDSSPTTKPQPMLAWWAIFPALLVVAMQLTLGLASVRERDGAGESGYLVGYATGSIVVALGMALFAAWIAYRASGRRQFPGSLTFLCVSLFLCLATFQGWAREQTQNAMRATANAGPTLFGPFQLEVPVGWVISKPQGARTNALLVLPGKLPNEPAGMILVESAETAEPSAQTLAKALTVHGGRVLPDPILIDGTTAYRYEGSSNDFSRPRHSVAFVHEGKGYFIQAAATEGVDVAGAFEHTIRTWRWTKRQ